MPLSRRALERLLILNTAIWILMAVVGISVLDRARGPLGDTLASIGAELGGWPGLVFGDVAPGSDPLPSYALHVAPRILRAAALSRPGPEADRDEALPWFPAVFVSGGMEYSVAAQLQPGPGRADSGGWRVRFEGESVGGGLRELVLVPAGWSEHATALVARGLARELDLVAPPGGFARLQINGVEAGAVFWSENLGRGTFARLGVPDGEILSPVSGALGLPAARIAPGANALQPADYVPTSATKSAPRRALATLAKLLALVRDPDDARFAAEVEQLLHVEHYLAWNALSALMGSSDADAFPDLAWYFDPITGRVEPLVERLRSGPGLTDTARFDAHDASRLTARLLGNPAHRQRRNEILWELVGDPERDVAEIADSRLGSLLVPLARAPGSLTRLHELSQLRSGAREALRTNAAAFRAVLASAQVDAQPALSHDARTPRIDFALTPRGMADVVLAEIRLDVDSLAFEREGEAVLRLRDPSGREVRRVRAAPEISGSTLVLRPEAVVLSPDPGSAQEPAVWHAELELPFFTGRSWARPGFVERVELHYRNSITGRPLPTATLYLDADAPDATTEGRVAIRSQARDVVRASGLPLALGDGELVLPAGRHVLHTDLAVPPAYRLRLEPGVDLRLAAGVSIHSVRGLHAEGLPDAPITIAALDPAHPWGALAIYRTPEDSRLRHVTLSGGSEATLAGIEFTGQVAFHAADAVLHHVTVRDGRADGLSLQRSRFDVANSRFVGNAGDGIDAGWSNGSVERSLVADNGDDGLDLGTSEVSVRASEFRQLHDKGISVGERSQVHVTNSVLADSGYGLVTKEDSRAVVTDTVFRANRVAIAAYSDNQAFRGGYASLRGGRLAGNVRDVEVAPDSKVDLDGVERDRDATLAGFFSSLASSGGL